MGFDFGLKADCFELFPVSPDDGLTCCNLVGEFDLVKFAGYSEL
jgi:hypothetical protein